MVILVRGNPYYPFMVELKSYVACMSIKSTFPYKGVVSCSPNVPYFAHPVLTGFMSMNGILKTKGLPATVENDRGGKRYDYSAERSTRFCIGFVYDLL